MKSKNTLLGSSVALLLSTATAYAEFSGNVALTSNYMFRGISQNDNEPAIQGGFDYAHDSGFYAGVWGSNVDDQAFASSSLELDTYLGWSGDLGLVAMDIGYLRYNYPGTDFNDNNTDEFHIGLSKDFGVAAASATVHYSPDFFGLNDGMYYDVGVDVPVGAFTLSAHYGVTDIDDKPGADSDYEDYKIGVATEYAGFGFDLSYVGSEDDGLCAGGPAICDEQVVFTISRSF